MKPPIDSHPPVADPTAAHCSAADHPFVAVVTGSSSGIGQSIAIELARRGAYVLLHARSNLEGLHQTVAHLRSHGSTAKMFRCIAADLTRDHSLDAMVRAAFAWHGYVNTWVHAAGADVLTGASAVLPFDAKLQMLWETDVRGTILASRRVAQEMLDRGVPHPFLPSIVHLGWDQAEHGMEGDSGQYFCAVKAAVAAFSKSLAKSVAPKVRVNTIAPGWIQTEWGIETSEPWSQRARGESLLQRWGTPGDIARVVASISMGDGEFVNGQTLAVNGGWCSPHTPVRSRVTRDPRPS
jgi:3-oxoacyl-[acyl-carrier protein] reductase